MRVNLLSHDEDYNPKTPLCPDWQTLEADLELDRTLDVMAGQQQPTGGSETAASDRGQEPDEHIRQVCTHVLFSPLQSAEAIAYRHDALRDALAQPAFIRGLYQVADQVTQQREFRWNYLDSHQTLNILLSADELMHIFIDAFKDLRNLVEAYADNCRSQAFLAFAQQIEEEFSDDYLAEMEDCLAIVASPGELLIGTSLGDYLQGVDYRPLQAWSWRQKWHRGHRLDWLHPALAYSLTERDELGAKDLSQRRARALNEVTNILAQSAEYLTGFFRLLHDELAFYVGCLNLADALRQRGLPTCFPRLLPFDSRQRQIDGLYDCSLGLGGPGLEGAGTGANPGTGTSMAAGTGAGVNADVKLTAGAAENGAGQTVPTALSDASVPTATAPPPVIVGNDLCVSNQPLTIITGANQGGKSTFLRSVGQAQLMAQAGLMVAATSCQLPLRHLVLTHFKKEEDKQMEHGKLDEELSRMDGLVEHLGPDCLILFNESFASTNEREGSQIHAQIVQALVENGVEVMAVTHLYDFAEAFLQEPGIPTLFLRAQRDDDGSRPFRVLPGQPLRTAYGLDLYARIFGEPA